MKKTTKSEIDILALITTIQTQLTALDKKIDTLINRPAPQQARPSPTPPVANAHPNEHNKERIKFTAICADCNKECTIPFKPSGDRPVYCQDCFSRRKVIKMSRIGMDEPPKPVEAPEPPVKKAPKKTAVKKPVAKKKATAKKK